MAYNILFVNRTFYDIMWKNTVEPEMTIRRKRFACQTPKASNTPSEHAIVIHFPLQQWLHERASA